MDKYISIKYLRTAMRNCIDTTINTKVNNLILTSKLMIAVDGIEKVINASYSDIFRIKNDLKNLINPQPELFGRLSVKDWDKLKSQEWLRVEAFTSETHFLIDILNEEYHQIIKLLPDQEKHIRHHNGNDNGNDINPLPDNIGIEIHHSSNVYKKLSQNVDWSCVFGYRILKVINNDK